MAEVLPMAPEGVRIRSFGNGSEARPRPLVLVNGIGAGVDNWGGFPDALAGPSLAVDVSGAERCADKPTMSDYSDALVESLEAIEPGPVDLLGISWGGALAMHTARRHGSRIHRLILGVTTFGMGAVPPKMVALRGLMSADRTSEKFLRQAPDIYGGDIRRQPELVLEAGITREIDRDSYGRQKQAIMRWSRHIASSLVGVSQIGNQTLILAGEDDPIARPANARLMALALRSAELRLVPGDEGGGHLLLHTRPTESAEIVEDFLSRREQW